MLGDLDKQPLKQVQLYVLELGKVGVGKGWSS